MYRILVLISLAVLVRGKIEVTVSENGTLTSYKANATVASSDPKIIYTKTKLNESVPVTISCNATIGSEKPTVNWYRDGKLLTLKDKGRNNEIINIKEVTNTGGLTTILQVLKPKPEHAGAYTCEFEVGTTKVNGTIYINSPPFILEFEKPKRAIQGDKLKIACVVTGFPKPTRVIWSFQNLTSDWSPRAGIELQDHNGIKDAKLLFTTLDFEDRGVYYCSATTGYGEDMSAVLVRAKNRLDALWPFLGIVAEVVVLVTAILIYEKKRSGVKKPAEVNGAAGGIGDTRKEEEDADVAADTKDADKEDIRQRTVKA